MLISVIIPTYQRIDRLVFAIDSVLNQTYEELEIILVDDNEDKNYLNEIKLKYKNEIESNKITYIKTKGREGGAKARNIGINFSKGKYIAFLDDDDEYTTNKLEEVLKNRYLDRGDEADLLYSYCYVKDEKNNNVRVYKRDIKKDFIYKHMLQNICATSQLVVKKSILKEINGFENVAAKQEYIMILKILLKTNKVKCIKLPLSIYVEHNDEVRISKPSLKKIKAEKTALKFSKEYFYLFDKNKQKNIEFSFFNRLYDLSHKMNDRKRMKYYLFLQGKTLTLVTIKKFMKNIIKLAL